MTPFDELQTLRNEVAQLRRENGDLGEKLGVAIQHRQELLGALEQLLDVKDAEAMPFRYAAAWRRAELAIQTVKPEAKP